MSLPVGLSGPLVYTNSEGHLEQVFAPIATTEGALVASMNRGVSVLNQSGGYRAKVYRKIMTRAPMFCLTSMNVADHFSSWLLSRRDAIEQIVSSNSNHAKLLGVRPIPMGRHLAVNFSFETGDASGQNMVTTCTWQVCLWLKREYELLMPGAIEDFVVDGNGSSDKKSTHDAAINGRGVEVIAECLIPTRILKRSLKVTPELLVDWYGRSALAASQSGMLGYNVNIANSIAGIFASTGQDLACIHESSVAYFFLEKAKDGVYVSLKIPRLVVATVGGGTHLPSQRQNLELMGCAGSGKIERFSEILAGFALGLELSTFSAMANGQFALAHERLGRNRPGLHLQEDDNLAKNIKEILEKDENCFYKKLDDMNDSNGIITTLTSENSQKFVGLSLWERRCTKGARLCVIKSKPSGKEVLNCLYTLTGIIDPKLAQSFDAYQHKSDFANCHLKEILIAKHMRDSELTRIHGTGICEKKQAYLISMDYLDSNDFRIINSELDSNQWDEEVLDACLHGLNSLHDRLACLAKDRVFAFAAKQDYLHFSRHALAVLCEEYQEGMEEFLALFTRCLDFLQDFDESTLDLRLIHNDFNPRNIAITWGLELVTYDFELARYDLVQRDLVELLSFIIDSDKISQPVSEIFFKYQQRFHPNTTQSAWISGIKYSLAKYICTRVSLYLLGNRLTRYPFVEKLTKNLNLISQGVGL